MSITFASLRALSLAALLAIGAPAVQAESTDAHHDDNAPQTQPFVPPMPGLGMTGPGGFNMGSMMQMMQMMQSQQMMQMSQMMQMMQAMQMMQSGQSGLPGLATPMPGGMPGGAGMQGGTGMQDGVGMPGGAAMMARSRVDVEPLIAYYKATLDITEAQLPQWNAFTDALRAGGKQLQQALIAAQGGADTAPALLERRATLLSAEAATMKQTQSATAALYAVLSDAQKRTADLLMADHLSRM